jgi:hypothetical protein
MAFANISFSIQSADAMSKSNRSTQPQDLDAISWFAAIANLKTGVVTTNILSKKFATLETFFA